MSEVLKPGPRWWRRVISVVAWFLLAVMIVGYVNMERREDDRRWCRLFDALTTDVPPPTTQRAREIAEIMADMKSDLGCEEEILSWLREGRG